MVTSSLRRQSLKATASCLRGSWRTVSVLRLRTKVGLCVRPHVSETPLLPAYPPRRHTQTCVNFTFAEIAPNPSGQRRRPLWHFWASAHGPCDLETSRPWGGLASHSPDFGLGLYMMCIVIFVTFQIFLFYENGQVVTRKEVGHEKRGRSIAK